MPRAIDLKIVDYKVVSNSQSVTQQPVERPECLLSRSYKIKPPDSPAYYITLSHLNGLPYELFINTKDVTHYQWVLLTSRMVSAVFRRVHSIEEARFIVEELQAIRDPVGGYFIKGHGSPISLAAHLGNIIDQFLNDLESSNEAE